MVALQQVVSNLERQRTVYGELEFVLGQQRAALMARDIATLDGTNARQALLVDALATLETERQGTLVSLPGGACGINDLLALAEDAGLRDRLTALRDHMPALVSRVMQLTRTNRVLASDAGASAGHLLGLLGVEQKTEYAPPKHQARSGGPCLRLDVTA